MEKISSKRKSTTIQRPIEYLLCSSRFPLECQNFPPKPMKNSVHFSEKVYSVCRKIPKGKVSTYGEMARVLDMKGYRAIGQALRCSPGMPDVPCHRVVKSDGSVGGFKGKTSGKEIEAKIRLLVREGVQVVDEEVNLGQYKFIFT